MAYDPNIHDIEGALRWIEKTPSARLQTNYPLLGFTLKVGYLWWTKTTTFSTEQNSAAIAFAQVVHKMRQKLGEKLLDL